MNTKKSSEIDKLFEGMIVHFVSQKNMQISYSGVENIGLSYKINSPTLAQKSTSWLYPMNITSTQVNSVLIFGQKWNMCMSG